MAMHQLLLSILLVEALGVTSIDISSHGDLGPKCKELDDAFNRTKQRYVSIFGKWRSVSVLYGARATGRAAGALLAAVLRHVYRYQHVALRPGPRTLCGLAQAYPDLYDNDTDYDELVVHVGAEWMKEEDETCEALRRCGERDLCGAAGPRFSVMGPPPAPMTLRLHARISPAAWANPACGGAHAWPFYANLSALIHCGFKQDLPAGLRIVNDISTTECISTPNTCVPVLVPPDWNTTYETAHALAARFNDSRLPLRIVPLADDLALRLLLDEESLINSSLLFLDYELWAGVHDNETRVLRVQSPPPEIEPIEALRVGDAYFLSQFAPRIIQALSRLKVQPYELRDVLEREAKGHRIEEAACDHINYNLTGYEIWQKVNESIVWAYVMLCDDPDYNEYKKVCNVVGNVANLSNRLRVKPIKCGDDHDLNQKLINIIKDLRYVQMTGVVGAGAGAAASAYLANMTETQLVLYDVPPLAAQLGNATRVAAGRLEQLVRATHHFFSTNNWKRIAVVSDKGSLARDFVHLLAKDDTLAIGERSLEEVNNEEVRNALKSLLVENARVFFINTGPVAASIIMCEALRLELTRDKGYAWIVREWNNSRCDLEKADMMHYTVSYWWRGGNDSALPRGSGNEVLRRKLDGLWPGRPWPMLAAPLADALILLDNVTEAGLWRHPSRRYDLHGSNATRDFAEGFSLSRSPTGVVQQLRQRRFALDAPLVFVDEWCGEARRLMAVWRVDGSTVHSLKELDTNSKDSTAIWDGTLSCYTKRTVGFSPTCPDGAVAALVALAALAPVVLWAAARVRGARLAAAERELRVRLVARCERTAAALADHLVDRHAVALHEELGKGHFGRVRRGTLALPHRSSMTVAVKELRGEAAPAEEAEFLREAVALAALGAPGHEHAHVVRLVRVCAPADGPPLLLMEYAFFGDLAKYLRERRHLAELIDGDDDATGDTETEARHVSARALTRLAREASAALAHVARMRFVHRDVRAANCLVDATRTLKLADFGMAREISPQGSERDGDGGGEGETEEYMYVCRRRGVFPVPWMAPESVRRGVFSRATDVWALGALLLETAALGARPFAEWRARRVLRHVRAGGHPPLPRDATYHACEIMEMCWQRAPDARPSAAAVMEYLQKNPTALRPALRPACDEHDLQGDSGFGERDPVECDPLVSTL